LSDTGTQPGGAFGHITGFEIEPLLVAPATGKEKNTFRLPLIPIACWRLDDVRFAFDSSILQPECRIEFQDLADLRKEFPGGVLSIFGHADPTGDENYNKQLSGRRAAVVYGCLTRDTALWEKLYTQPFGGDNWGTRARQTMLTAVGFDTKGVDGVAGQNTQEATKQFQKSKGISPTGLDTADTRKALFTAYMDFLCVDRAGAPYTVKKSEFLAKNADAGGRGDYQGCSEFNPVLIFSREQDQEFKKASNKAARDAANGPNRRVTALIFRPGSEVPPDRWPCPSATEGVAKCKARFWSDAAVRSAPGDKPRHFEITKDTFSCRFYHRLTATSPCEETVKYWVVRILAANDKPLDKREPLIDTPFLVTGEDGGPPRIKGTTDKQGILRIRVTADKTRFKLTVGGFEVLLDAGALLPPGATEQASHQRLCNMGYGPAELATWKQADAKTACEQFQEQHELTKSGQADAATVAKLKEIYGS
jgi:peptidoglycan hydrolase-like protein with peptidoglycan-binding domain